MRIGIDIDDTITDTWSYMVPIYSHIFNIPTEELSHTQPYYNSVKKLNLTIDDYFKIMQPYYRENTLNIPIKKDAQEVINILKKEGHKIIFITARGKMYHEPKLITKTYLEKNDIKYDKLIINANDKATICKKENIDLFIDDSYKHCQSVSSIGIKVLMFGTNYNKNIKEFTRITSWYEVYNYINKKVGELS